MSRVLPVAIFTAMLLGAFAASAGATPALTTPQSPVATSLPATEISSTGGTLNGTIDSKSADTGYAFEWGTTVANMTPESFGSVLGTDIGTHAVSHKLSGLEQGRTYVYRLIATSEIGGTCGEVLSFTTTQDQPPAYVRPPKQKIDVGFKVEVVESDQTMERARLKFKLPQAGRGTVTGSAIDDPQRFTAFSRSFSRRMSGDFNLPATLSSRALGELRRRGVLRISLRTEFTPAGSRTAQVYKSVVALLPFSITSYGTVDNNQTVTATLRTPRSGRLAVKFLLRDKATGRSFKVRTFKTRKLAGGSYVYSAHLTAAARRAISVGKVWLMVKARFQTTGHSARMLRSRIIPCRFCGAR